MPESILMPYDGSPKINSLGCEPTYFHSFGMSLWFLLTSLISSRLGFSCKLKSSIFFSIEFVSLSIYSYLSDGKRTSSLNVTWIDSLTVKSLLLKTLYALLLVE